MAAASPIQSSNNHSFYDIKKLRARALYDQDKNMPLRKSHLNPVLQKMLRGVPGRARKPQGPRDPPHLLRQARLLMKY